MTETCYTKLCITNQYYLFGLKYQKGTLSKMNTILPSYFVFSRANSLYQRPIAKELTIKTANLIILALVIICLITFIWAARHGKDHPILSFTPIVTALLLIVMAPILIVRSERYTLQRQDYSTWGFKMPQTNLLVLPAKLTNLGTDFRNGKTAMAVTSNLVDPFEKVKRAKYALYVNANCTEVSPDKTDSDNMLLANAYCLGTMDHGKFKPEKSEIGATFANYQKYIKQHHLENHFKQKMIFINSNKYLTNDYQDSLVLIGDNDYILHLSGTKKIIAKTDSNKIVAN